MYSGKCQPVSAIAQEYVISFWIKCENMGRCSSNNKFEARSTKKKGGGTQEFHLGSILEQANIKEH